MKTYYEIAKYVFEKRDEAIRQKKVKRKKALMTLGVVLPCMIVAIAVIGLWKGEFFGNNSNNPPKIIVEKEEYTILEVSENNQCEFSGVEQRNEINIIGTLHEDENAIRSKLITLDDETVKVEYLITADDNLLNGITLRYMGFGKEKLLALIYSADDKLLGKEQTFRRFDGYEPLEANPKSELECLEIAKETLEDVVTDASAYTLMSTEYMTTDRCKRYLFTFSRKNGNLNTMDIVEITVHVSGLVIRYYMPHVGDMAGVATVPDAVASCVIKTVVSSVKAKYEAVKESFTLENISEDDTDLMLVILKDGTVALDVTLDVLVGKNGTDESATETHRYIVPLE